MEVDPLEHLQGAERLVQRPDLDGRIRDGADDLDLTGLVPR
jgi:hypothetical protein